MHALRDQIEPTRIPCASSPKVLGRPQPFLTLRLARYRGTMRTESVPRTGIPSTVLPIRTPTASPETNPVLCVLKWQTKSGRPSPFTSSVLQKAKLDSSPLRPKVSEVWSIRATASNVRLDKTATGMFPLLPGLMLSVESPGLMSMATGMNARPVPVRPITCGLLGESSVMVSLPILVPAAVGAKVILTVQFAPTARLPTQVLVSEKSPLATTLEILKGTLPALLKSAVCAPLVVPTAWLENESLFGNRARTGVFKKIEMKLAPLPELLALVTAKSLPPAPLKSPVVTALAEKGVA